MIGLLIVAHAPLASAMADVVEHILGEQPAFSVVDVNPDAPREENVSRLQATLEPLDTGDGVLVLTDIMGATPANLARDFLRKDDIIMIGGLSVPLLIKVLTNRTPDTTLPALLQSVMAVGPRFAQIVAAAEDQPHDGVVH